MTYFANHSTMSKGAWLSHYKLSKKYEFNKYICILIVPNKCYSVKTAFIT